MAKKKPNEPTAQASTTTTATTTTAPMADPVATVPTEATRLERAFAVGNYAAVRRASLGPSGDERDAALALMPRIVVEPVQVAVGVIALVVVLTVAALTLH
jgi:hypothetical protein